MEIDTMYMSTINGNELEIRVPKVIATISICGHVKIVKNY